MNEYSLLLSILLGISIGCAIMVGYRLGRYLNVRNVTKTKRKYKKSYFKVIEGGKND